MGTSSGEQAATVFEQHRSKLLGLSYRLLGRMGEAEEVVQDAFLRWFDTDRTQVREPAAFLVTTVTRLSLDRLKSARARHEHYVGPWLPEPLMTNLPTSGPLDAVEQGDLISFGLLRLLERLSAPERAVFVLREAFELSYEDIAPILGLEVANCRQLFARAQKRLAEDRNRFVPHSEEHVRLVTEFYAAARKGDLQGLQAFLSDDVVSYSDGGGHVRAALNPVRGADRVARLIAGLAGKYKRDFENARIAEINGRPGLVMHVNGALHAISVDIEDGRIRNLYDVCNPEKLVYLERQLAQTDAADASRNSGRRAD